MKSEVVLLQEKIELFRKNIKDYTSTNYDEYNTRADFVDVLFSALGWDMYNRQGVIELFREVVREDKVIIEGRRKAPDYAFKIGPHIVFYVEAKKPSIDIKNDPEPAYQLRRYAYSKGLELSILTNFAQIAVYDTRIMPQVGDKAFHSRIFYCTYDELYEKCKDTRFETNFDFLLKTFGKQAILNGSFNAYAQEKKGAKGTASVDEGFLNLLNNWREKLAVGIALKNEEIDEYNLNLAVQRIIDSLVFLRIAEDRLIEEPNYLLNQTLKPEIYKSLIVVFRKADAKYNSGLFDYPEWLSNLKVEDKLIKEIIEEMYYPCPYEFSVLPIEILGNAYEQFLGKTIKYLRHTKYGHKVIIEEKPEVRKAGGIYYTPKKVVDYIVEKTVGRLIDQKSPDQISTIRVLDPSCGSGSFLIGAYEYLLRYHLAYYLQNKTAKKIALKEGTIYQVSGERYKLSTAKKIEILTQHIFGVDLDPLAVEVTKLSLLLKVLEDENLEYKEELFKAEHYHILPDLKYNIKCGNSLIKSDYYDSVDLSDLQKAQMRKINVFDWEKEFSFIMNHGGFDCIIGNPPYGSLNYTKQSLKDFYKDELPYWQSSYELFDWRINFVMLFYEMIFKKENLLRDNGMLGMIIDFSFLDLPFKKVRDYLFETTRLSELAINLKYFKVNSSQVITILEKDVGASDHEFVLKDESIDAQPRLVKQSNLLNLERISSNDLVEDESVQKINNLKNIDSLGHLFHTTYGAEIGGKKDSYPYFVFDSPGQDGDYIPLIDLDNFWEYSPIAYKQYLRYDKAKEREITKKFPKLNIALRDRSIWKQERVILRQSAKKLTASYDNEESTSFLKAFHIYTKDERYHLKYLLGLLNSDLIDYYCSKTGINMSESGKQPQIRISGLRKIPIRLIDFEDENDVAIYKKIINLVDNALSASLEITKCKFPGDKKLLEDKLRIIKKQINGVVNELYCIDAH